MRYYTEFNFEERHMDKILQSLTVLPKVFSPLAFVEFLSFSSYNKTIKNSSFLCLAQTQLCKIT
jgi:hypothetical protein